MNISLTLLDIVWYVTAVLFVISTFAFFSFFLVKKVLESKKSLLKTKQMKYAYYDIDRPVDLSKKVELVAYCRVLGMRLLTTTEEEKRVELKKHIVKMQLFEKLLKVYEKSNHYSQLYLFSSLVLFADVKGRELFLSMFVNPKNDDIPEFKTLALFGLAISTKNKEHLMELYEILEKMDKEEFLTQKFSEFFLIQAYISLGEDKIADFLNTWKPKTFNSVCCALIYALQTLPSSPKIYQALLKLNKEYNESLLLIATLRIQAHWKIKNSDLLLKNYNHINDVVRIVISRIALDIVKKEEYGLFSLYLYDENFYVRKNFLVSLAQVDIPLNVLRSWIVEYYPTSIENVLLEKSLTLYEKGIS
jgi:hypothetical protein